MKEARYLCLSGKQITSKFIKSIIELDKIVFRNNNEIFYKNPEIPEEKLLSYLTKNIDATILIYDTIKQCAVAYFNALPLTENFVNRLLQQKLTFSDLTKKDILLFKSNNKYNLCILSLAILPEYQGKKIIDKYGALNNKEILCFIITEFAKIIIKLKRQNIVIETIITECVSKKGDEFAKKNSYHLLNLTQAMNTFILIILILKTISKIFMMQKRL